MVEERTCPACGAPAPGSYPRCGQCGARFEAGAASSEVRRFATVVNSDLKGSTALGERLDPESLREVLSLYFDEMRAVFESHGGTIEKIIGDAIVAVFGLPIHHDDDALRAVEAAAASQRTLADLNDRLERLWGVRLVVRTGVATGDVVFGEATLGQHVLTGDTMRISSAMEQNAPPLEVLIAGSTYEIVRDHVTARAMDPVTPKGMEIQVPAWQLLAVDARRQAVQPATEDQVPSPGSCPACGEANPPDFRLCGVCGTTLALTAAVRESRKTVTLVFADPKPTTLDGSPPDPEALRDVMSRYFEAMRRALEHHGGTVEKFIGDAVMAVFGLPVRHEDDAIRAVRAAADMQAALPALNEDFRARWGLELRNHIGVNTGEVIAGDASLGQRLVTGDAVNTAARLEQAAGAQEIVLGDLTYRLARDQIEVEPVPPLSLKGKAEPVPAYRLLHVRRRPVERSASATPFVGREAELARLAGAYEEASRARAARLITVIGDAGVGKSRLVREFAASTATRAGVVRGRCLPYGDGITFWPIGEVVRGVAGITDEDGPEVALARIAAVVTGGPSAADDPAADDPAADDPAAIAERVGAAIGLSRTQFQMPELFWGIRKFLESVARRRPLLVIVDDVQFAAPAFLELLDHLLAAAVDAPMLLLVTARHELVETRDDWAANHADGRIVLEPLTSTEADSVIDRLLAGLDAGVRERIAAAAEGNPLYVEQIVAMLVETGAIRRDADRWLLADPSAELRIPPTVRALVAARLDALGDEERGVIEPASVIGLSFPKDAVRELVEPQLRPVVASELDALTSKQLIRPSSRAEEELYRFNHAVIKDTAYDSLLKRLRASLHERFVDWAERINRERGRETEFEEIHGYHLEQAFRYLGELGPLDERGLRIGQRAAEKLASAGRRSLARADMASAANLLGRASAVLPAADRRRVELLPDLAEAQFELGELDVMSETVAAATREVAVLGDDALAARVAIVGAILALYAPSRAGGAGDVGREVGEVVTRLEAAGDHAGLARAWRILAMVSSKAGQYDDAVAAADHMIDEAVAANDQRLVLRGAAGYASQAVYSSRPVAELLPRLERLLVEAGGDRKAEGRIALELAQLHAMDGGFDEARRLVARGQRLVWDLGPSLTGMTTSIQAARVEMLGGDLRAAEAELRRDAASLEAVGETYYRSFIVGVLARVLWDLGRHDEAAQLCELARSIADEDDTESQIGWRLTRSRVLAAAGDGGDADRLSLEAVDLAAGSSDLELQADVLVDRATLLMSLSGPESAGPPLREALRRYERKGDRVSAAKVRSMLGEAISPV